MYCSLDLLADTGSFAAGSNEQFHLEFLRFRMESSLDGTCFQGFHYTQNSGRGSSTNAKPFVTLCESCRYRHKSLVLARALNILTRAYVTLARALANLATLATLTILDQSSESGGNLEDRTKSGRCSLVQGSGNSAQSF